MFGSFPKFHKRNISTEIILKLAYNFCRRALSFLNYYCANIAADWRQPDLQNACNNYTKTTIASTISSEFLRKANHPGAPSCVSDNLAFLHIRTHVGKV